MADGGAPGDLSDRHTAVLEAAADHVDCALVAGEDADRVRLDAGIEPPAHVLFGTVELLGRDADRNSRRRRSAARRAVAGRVGDLIIKIEVLRAGQHAAGEAQDLLSRPVVERQSARPADDANAATPEHDRLAVDALLGVVGDEQIVGPLGHQRSEELPLRRRQVLPLVDEDMVGDACLGRGVAQLGGDGADLAEVDRALHGGGRTIGRDHIPDRAALDATERDPAPRAPNAEVGVPRRHAVGEHDRLRIRRRRTPATGVRRAARCPTDSIASRHAD